MRSLSRSLVVLLVIGCGAATPPAAAPASSEAAASAPAPTPIGREGVVDRAALDAVLSGGLGRFLQAVSTEPHLEDGRFVGFRLTRLDAPYFEGVNLRAGDTVLSVNALPIERPEQALAAFDGLRVASELTVEILRDGERQQLRYAIEE